MTTENRTYALSEELLNWGGVNVKKFVVAEGASSNRLPSGNKQLGSRIRIERQQTASAPSIEEFNAGVRKSMALLEQPVKEGSPGLLRRITSGFQGRQPSKA